MQGWIHRLAGMSATTKAALLLSLLFLVANLFLLDVYGISKDEAAVLRRGKLGLQMMGFLPGPPQPTEDVFHPSFYGSLNFLAKSFFERTLHLNEIAAGHVLNILATTLGLVGTFFLARLIFDERVALWSLIFLATYPRLIPHAHFNSKDIPEMAFFTWTVLFHLLSLRTKKLSLAVAAGISWAFALGTKLDALWIPVILLGSFGISRMSTHGRRELRAGPFFRMFSITILVGAAVGFLLWPILWNDPLWIIHSVQHFGQPFATWNISYLGQLYPATGLPWHYTALHLLIGANPLVLSCLGLGIAALVARFQTTPYQCTLLALWIVLPLGIRALPRISQYDGMRHVFFLLPAFSLLAAGGFESLAQAIKARLSRYALKLAGWVLCFLPLFTTFPFQASYINFFGRLAGGTDLPAQFDTWGWAANPYQGLRWVNAHAPSNARVAIVGIGPDLLPYYKLRSDLNQVLAPAIADFVISTKPQTGNLAYLGSINSCPLIFVYVREPPVSP